MVKQSEGIDPKLLELLVCPITKQPLTYNKRKQVLESKTANLVYPIREGVPIMLAEEASQLKK